MPQWKGWYQQGGFRHDMKISKFKVKGSKIEGKGADDEGHFEFIGFYGPDGHTRFIKQYEGKHQVAYEGRREGQTISGHWEVNGMKDEFHIFKERKWAGHYNQHGVDHEMELASLKFKKGHISGKGQDTNGAFEINGTIQPNGDLEF